MRISYYVQKLAFSLALVVPLAILVVGPQIEILYLAIYVWAVGIVAAIWNRLTVVE